MSKPKKFLSAKQVAERTTLNRVTIWRLTKEGRFPAAYQIVGTRMGWLESEVEAWIDSRTAWKKTACDRATERTAA